tara:strand:+ start:1583 stop:2260 length:678 start_codon:yes stop_codon:yes gene_type:complete
LSYTLIIPIYNEERTLPVLLRKLDRLDDKIEIIIIDDGSDDSTKDLLIESNQIIIIRNETNLGKGTSIKKGIDLASRQTVVLIDGDLEVDIDNIPRLIKEYESFELSNKKAVVGVRWNNGYLQYLNLMRMGNFIINLFFNVLYRTSFQDILCCCKIIDKERLKSFNLTSSRFSIETEIMLKLVENDFTIWETPISYNPRSFDQGKKIKIRDSINIFMTMIRHKFR